MARWIAVVSACVLAGTLSLAAGQARGGGSGNGGARQQELQTARATLQQHAAELKRLQNQLKVDRRGGDKVAIQRDHDAIKMTQVLVRQDQDRIRQIQSDRPNRGGGRQGDGNGRAGRGGRGQ